ncbi:MAG: serine/threonine-protein kinase [Planctomycetota bacterium]|nr:serine/threonine-protein kinase [Planctomycetota bacterium]
MQVGTYRLIAPLPRGDLARYQAIDTRTDAPIEVRLLGSESTSKEDVAGLRKRLATASLVESPTVRVIESVELDAQPRYIALQWLDGPKLSDLQESQPLGRVAAIHLVQQLAAALPPLHRVGFVHSAICPSNIQRCGDLRWTIDCTYPIDPALGSQSVSDFRAPEANRGEPEPASDVFSVAAILYWLLFEEDFGKKNEAGLDLSRLAEALASDHGLKPIATTLASLLSVSLASDPAERPEAADFARQLHSCVRQLTGVSAATLPSLDQTLQMTRDVSAVKQPDQTVALEIDPILPADDSMPAQLGRFRIMEKLGEGGMGAVYRGEDLADGTVVAIKVLGKIVARDAQSRRRFAKEARMLARTRSPYVANLLEFNADEGTDYLVIEFLPGRNLGELLKKEGSLSEEIALALMVDVARGLSVAHDRGIVHRDIKPDNLLLTKEGVQAINQHVVDQGSQQPLVKVSDFGLASGLDQSESLAITRQGAVLGTPFYMPPEQCRGEATDARSDVYSMGATLFHLLAGRPPYVAKTHVAILNQHSHDPIPSLAKFKPGISSGIERVVEKTLAKNPDARYENAGALLVDLENLLHGNATSLVLHPVIPQRNAASTLEFEFTWTLSSSAAQLWPFVANTDRLNQAMGLPPARFSTSNDPERGVRRFAETRIAGQRIAWEEHPFEWIEGRRMSVLREFLHGPFDWFVNIVELTPQADGGTLLSHKVLLEPKNLLGRFIAKLEIGMRARRSLTRIYQQIDGFVASGKHNDPTADAFRRSVALTCISHHIGKCGGASA